MDKWAEIPAPGPAAATELHVIVEAGSAGMRLDQMVAAVLPGVSRSLVSHSIRLGQIKVDGRDRKSSYRLKEGESVNGRIEPSPEIEIEAEEVPFTLLYEDQHLLLLSKPPGVVVHPGSGNQHGTLAHGLVRYCQAIAEVGERTRPGIVHRLDKDTSGIMLVAKNNSVHRQLAESFKNHLLEKEYLALVHGSPPEAEGRIVAAIGRHPVHRQKMAIRPEGGRHAVSSWRQLCSFPGGFSLLQVAIETGRTHQIRVHLAHLGCPVAGDQLYGPGRDNHLFPRQMLHAARLAFTHPVTGQRLNNEAPLWPDFLHILENLAERSGK
jgi:23S rRNA pseudouridine1911/1915/1917 synthase